MSRCQYTVGNGWHGKGRLSQGCGALSLVGHNKKRPWMQPVVVFMVFLCYKPFGPGSIVFAKEGRFLSWNMYLLCMPHSGR